MFATRTHAIVQLAGTLDRGTVGQLAEDVSRCSETPARVVIDLRDVTFMDVGGLNAILDAHAIARRQRRGLEIIPGPRNVQRVFELTGADAGLRFVSPVPPASGPAATSDR